MDRQPLKKSLLKYKQKYSEESETIRDVLGFLETNKNCFNRDNEIGHFTGSAWVIDRERTSVLMTHHKKLNLWLQLGGHADGCPHLQDVAYSEAKEESGLNRFLFLSKNIFDLDIHLIPPNEYEPQHFHYDIRFLLETDHGPEDIVISDESHDVAWVRFEDVNSLNPEKSIERMLKKTQLRSWE